MSYIRDLPDHLLRLNLCVLTVTLSIYPTNSRLLRVRLSNWKALCIPWLTGLAGLADEDEDEDVMEKGSQFTEADRKFMRRAVELATKAQGQCRARKSELPTVGYLFPRSPSTKL